MRRTESATGQATYVDTSGRAIQVALLLVLILATGSAFAVSYAPLYEIALQIGLPAGVALFLPLALDLGAVASALSSVILRARQEGHVSAIITLLFVMGVSVTAQVLHAYQLESRWSVSTLLAALILASAPVSTVMLSHLALKSLTAKPARRSRGKRTQSVPASAPAKEKVSAKAVDGPQVTKPVPEKPVVKAVTDSEVPARNPGENEVAYAVRLYRDHGVSQRRAAELAGTTRTRMATLMRRIEEERAA